MDQKSLVKISLLVIAIALVGAVSYFIFAREVEPLTQKTTTTSPTHVDETVHWNTYTDAQHGFEVRYPIGYEIVWDDDTHQDEGAPFTIRKTGSNSEDDYVFAFENLPNFLGGNTGKMKNPEEWNDNQIRLGNAHTKTSINGQIVYMSEYGASGFVTHFRFVRNLSTYDMNWFSVNGNGDIGGKIFSTIKFIK